MGKRDPHNPHIEFRDGSMKESVRKLVERLRGRLATSSLGLRARLRGEASFPFATDGREFKSGDTVFDDRALRFRSLTMADGGMTGLEEPGVEQSAFKIRIAKQAGFRMAAGTLVEKRYGNRGYNVTNAPPHDPNLYTFVAYDEGKLVGTVSIRFDSPQGLSADALYKDEIDFLRRDGCKVCEFTRLAVDTTTVSKPVLAGLFHTAYLFAAAVRDYTFAVIEVNPRHIGFYSRALAFEQIGPERMNLRVQAPAVLLCVPFETIAEGLRRYGGKQQESSTERSLFPYGFSREEEVGILQRLRTLQRRRR
jgi:hypothetical protein